jgi:hypothetical protein
LLLPLLRNTSREGWLMVICVVLVLLISPVVGTLILGPVNRAAGRLQAPTRFLLPDFMWLVVQLQLALGYCVTFVGVQTQYFFPLALGFFTLASLMMWAGAVSFLSRAGVRSTLRRGLFILILMPTTLALMIGTPLLPVVAYVLEDNPQEVERLFRLEGMIPRHAGWLLLAVAALAVPAVGILLHRLGRWMVVGVTPPDDPVLVKQPAT